MTKKGWTLTFFANLDVLVLKQVCQKEKKKEKNTGTVIWASTFFFFNSFYLFALETQKCGTFGLYFRPKHQTGTTSTAGPNRDNV